MTYGWAILIIVIIGGALYALGVFNPATWTSSKRATGFASLQVKDWKLTSSATNGATLVVGNKYGTSMDITGFALNTTATTRFTCNLVPATAVALAENQETTVVSAACGNSTSISVGNQYTAAVEIYFTANGVDHIDSGTITGKVE